ncbi:MAG TPA: phosphatase PAP2 family protein [Actinomycetota bacterium]|nr:phosphatase PAP2 family protein [Actinomycetota bacterium]
MTTIAARPKRAHRQRRPSGEPPPLPRKLERSGRLWLGAAITGLLVLTAVAFIGPTGEFLTKTEDGFLRWIEGFRNGSLTRVAETVAAVGSDWTVGILLWAAIITLVAFKHFRHLFVLLGSVLAVGVITEGLNQLFIRPRPAHVDIIGHWAGSSMPSRPMAALAVALIGVTYATVVPGRFRSWAKLGATAILAAFALTGIYLGVTHPLDLAIGGVIGVAVPIVAFRWLIPNDIFPVSYKRGKAAHLDVEGERGRAITKALESQLGLALVSVKPFGLAGSGGSTPLRLTVEDEETPYLFAKLYAATHLRADRWYKLGRTLLYGRLEDEASFSTVRRLIQYEDYMLRVMRDAGLPTARPMGFIEISPEREYLIVTEFFDGAREILDGELNNAIIDNALAVVRRLWDAGLAHRDIKPSNLLVRNDQVHLIDVAFGQVRPSPWRQAVDLANMMLVLALKSTPELVYERALVLFTPEEIGEAFAATRGVTIPSQSRGMLRSEQRDIVARFKELAPPCRRVSIQRWSWRRLGLTLAVLVGAAILTSIAVDNVKGMGLFGIPRASETYASVGRAPECRPTFDEQSVLLGQSVPSAAMLPCLNPMPQGWRWTGFKVIDGKGEIKLRSDRARGHPVTVTLAEDCDVQGASQVPSDELGTDRYERIDALRGRYTGTRFYRFDGGCVTYDFDFTGEGRTALAEQASLILGFKSRTALGEAVEARVGINPF